MKSFVINKKLLSVFLVVLLLVTSICTPLFNIEILASDSTKVVFIVPGIAATSLTNGQDDV